MHSVARSTQPTMARITWLALSLSTLALLGLVSADVQITTPAGGAKLTGGGTISIEWKESGDEPKISELLTYQIFLCAGGNTDAEYVRGLNFLEFAK